MKKFLSLTLALMLLCAMLLTAIPTNAVTAGPYNYEVGCIQEIELLSSKVLGRNKANYYSTLVGSLMQNEESRLQYYETHAVVGSKDAKFFVYSAASEDNLSYGLKTTLDIAKDFEKANPDYQVLAAINGDFFNTSTGETESPMIQDGNMLKAYILNDMIGRGIVGIDDTNGQLVYHTIGSNYKDAGYGTDYTFNGTYQVQVLNADKSAIEASYSSSLANAPTSTQISFVTPDSNVGSYLGKNVYVVELEAYRNDTGSHNKNPRTTDYYYAYGKITEAITGSSYMKPAAGKVYIAVNNDTQAPALKVGAYVKCQKVLSGAWENVSQATGFKQQLMADGKILFENMYSRYHHSLTNVANGEYDEKDGYYCACGSSKAETEKWTEDLYDYPMCWKNRTAIGFKPDGTCVFMTIGRSIEDGWGATYVEIASQLKALGCNNAFLLDGGGSSTMVIRQNGALTTVFKGEEGTAGEGRVVANIALLAVPKEAPLNTTDINSAIAKAEAMKKDDYTAANSLWTALTEAINSAKTAIADETSTQEAIDKALENINKAIAEIEKTKKPAPAETEAPKQTEEQKQTETDNLDNEVPEPAVDNSGCTSSISLAAIITVGAIGAPLAINKKRKRK